MGSFARKFWQKWLPRFVHPIVGTIHEEMVCKVIYQLTTANCIYVYTTHIKLDLFSEMSNRAWFVGQIGQPYAMEKQLRA
jgi:hypothetical protein